MNTDTNHISGLKIGEIFTEEDLIDLKNTYEIQDTEEKFSYEISFYIEKHIEYILEKFYTTLKTFEKTSKFFNDNQLLERLKNKSKEYFIYMFRGPFDYTYYQSKIKIGYTHYVNNVPLNSYLNAMSYLSSIFLEIWHKEITDSNKLILAEKITTKLFYIEINLCLQAFFKFPEENLKKERDAAREILDSLSAGYFAIDSSLKVIAPVSKSCFFIFERQIFGLNIINFFPSKEIDKVNYLALCLEHFFKNQQEIKVDISLFPKQIELINGKIINLTYTPILDENKKPKKIIFSISDITKIVEKNRKINEENKINRILIEILKNKDEFIVFMKRVPYIIVKLMDMQDIESGKQLLFELQSSFEHFCLTEIAFFITQLEKELHERQIQSAEEYQDIFSSAGTMITSMLKKFLTENYEVLGIQPPK